MSHPLYDNTFEIIASWRNLQVSIPIVLFTNEVGWLVLFVTWWACNINYWHSLMYEVITLCHHCAWWCLGTYWCQFISSLNDHDDIIKWKHFPYYRPFVQGIHWSPVNSPRRGQWRRALMFSLIWAWINGWVNNRDAGDLRCHRADYDVTVMWTQSYICIFFQVFLDTCCNSKQYCRKANSNSICHQDLWQHILSLCTVCLYSSK